MRRATFPRPPNRARALDARELARVSGGYTDDGVQLAWVAYTDDGKTLIAFTDQGDTFTDQGDT